MSQEADHAVTFGNTFVINNANLFSSLSIFGNNCESGAFIFDKCLEVITDSDLHLMYHFLISKIGGSISENCICLLKIVREFFKGIYVSLAYTKKFIAHVFYPGRE